LVVAQAAAAALKAKERKDRTRKLFLKAKMVHTLSMAGERGKAKSLAELAERRRLEDEEVRFHT
jgi:hypothetical protein